MTYRLITNALLSITNAAGEKMERNVSVRAYPAPKRDASGAISIDGSDTTFQRTGGKGRGTVDNRYMYAVVKQTPAFWAITEAQAAALVGGVATLTSVAAQVATPDELAMIQAAVDKHGAEAVVAAAQPVARVARRIKHGQPA